MSVLVRVLCTTNVNALDPCFYFNGYFSNAEVDLPAKDGEIEIKVKTCCKEYKWSSDITRFFQCEGNYALNNNHF